MGAAVGRNMVSKLTTERLDTEDRNPSLHSPYLPPGPPPLLFEEFAGINTSTSRPGVLDKEMWWCDGFMPIGRRLLRTMYDVGEPIHFQDSALISFFGFINIGPTPYCIVIHNDGSVHAVNTETDASQEIAAAGTIQSPSRLNTGISQYGNQYCIIVSSQTDGYFLWDGDIFCRAGSLSPEVTLTSGGTGYTTNLVITATGGSGSGATFDYTLSGGVVTSVWVTNPGSGYVAGDTVTLVFTRNGGSGTAASGTVNIMPFAISGTAAETYSGHVWVANGTDVAYTAPGSATDFSTNNGGGNFSSTDSFLRVKYVALVSTNGFLYLIADSSINYISGVSTTGTPPTTSFTNQNADPETGSPWPSTVGTFGRNILLGNAFGAHISYGAAVTKISEALDGLFNTVPNFGGLIPSAAKAIVFGKKCWVLLLPIIDPVSGQQVNKLFMWNGKIWWATEQSITIQYIANQEIDSILTTWGTDGTAIYPLFQEPSNDFVKIVQSRFWDNPIGYQMLKTASRAWVMGQIYELDDETLDVSIDNEGESAVVFKSFEFNPPEILWFNDDGDPIEWESNSGDPMEWFGSGAGVAFTEPSEFGQKGIVMGLTLKTSKADMAIISAMLQSEPHDYRG